MPTVIPQIGFKIDALAALVDGLDARGDIPQIEFIAGDPTRIPAESRWSSGTCSRCRKPTRTALAGVRQGAAFAIFLQPGGHDSRASACGRRIRDLRFACRSGTWSSQFRPLDFIQVNAGTQPEDDRPCVRAARRAAGGSRARSVLRPRQLHLAAGARVREVVGVEGDAGLVLRAPRECRAQRPGQCAFPCRRPCAGPARTQLDAADAGQGVDATGFDRLLLDPPRSGADAVLKQLPLEGLKRIVYVSCHPGSLARDAGYPGQRARLEVARGRSDGHVPAYRARREHCAVRAMMVSVMPAKAGTKVPSNAPAIERR